MKVTVLYSCHGCGLTQQPCEVDARGDKEDIMSWMEHVQFQVGQNHHFKSPGCASRVCDLMIPITGVDRIGGVPVN